MPRALIIIGIGAAIAGAATMGYQLWWIYFGTTPSFASRDSELVDHGAVTAYGWTLFSVHTLVMALVAATLCAAVIVVTRLFGKKP